MVSLISTLNHVVHGAYTFIKKNRAKMQCLQ